MSSLTVSLNHRDLRFNSKCLQIGDSMCVSVQAYLSVSVAGKAGLWILNSRRNLEYIHSSAGPKVTGFSLPSGAFPIRNVLYRKGHFTPRIANLEKHDLWSSAKIDSFSRRAMEGECRHWTLLSDDIIIGQVGKNTLLVVTLDITVNIVWPKRHSEW